ncbi:hypothetical protein NLU13_2021 [Sarocladium strictum]|uniref:Uncharacterized protein n=1 Tax=Sarocladium strictum TaxID=5046 RepID=A0AA39GSA8_SARSR|nr:hypothetical protein NLU13_2021 [Sarocladium strictum]
MEPGRDDPDAKQHAVAIEYTLKELHRHIAEHEAKLEKIRPTKDDAPLSSIAQTKLLTMAFEEEAESQPFLPFPSSVLPALLALRKTHNTIQESRRYLSEQQAANGQAKRSLDADHANLKDQKLLTDALNARIAALQEELDSKADLTPQDAAREKIDELKTRKKYYDKETSRLMKALMNFINERLAAQLAAEELGGPVVGDLMEIDSNDLAGGFNAQGKLKKTKAGPDDDKRQRRLDEIWGQVEGGAGAGKSDEISAAGAEMRELTEDLLNQLATSKGDTSASYVTLPRESAAARFLVRSKVAQFHPKDATRLRLIDFGRDLDP